jgi:RimJ/RimL family protein N-acetyltransferase
LASDIQTPRLRLAAWTPANLDALMELDAVRLKDLLDAQFPDPLRAPPETDDILLFMRNLLATDELARAWPPRFIIRVEDQMVVGSAGTGFPTGDPATSVIGYGVYPEFEGCGFATEAARGLVAWAFHHPETDVVRATVHGENVGSRRVVTKSGLRETGDQLFTDDGLLDVWEIDRAYFAAISTSWPTR